MTHGRLSRRHAFRLTGAATAASVLAGLTARPATAGVSPAQPGAPLARVAPPVAAFALSDVRLLPGPFADNQNRTLSYLSFVDADRLLHTFRRNVGLPSTATPCGGWEAPDVELRGHSTGHLLTALAQAFASTGDSAYQAKASRIVSALAACQAAAPAAGYGRGYLSAYPESFIDRVENGQQVWAPYYTLHKIMAGLLDQYLLAGNQQALDVLVAKAAWVKARTDRLSTARLQAMLRTEFGGMNEVLANLYLVTGDQNHLTTATRFDHAEIFDPLANRLDRLAGYHANTQIPKIIGAIQEYQATGQARYRDIATFFWDTVVGHHTYANGGNSNGEHFHAPDAIASQLSDSTTECCNTYNMLKLTRQLFRYDPSRIDYLDYYENALLNQILGSQDPASAHGFVSYYVPLRAGGIKTYSNDYDTFWCCHGTGMENHTKFGDTIYFHTDDALYVNLFIPSELTWRDRGLVLRQETRFPTQPSTRLTVRQAGGTALALRLRVPSWVAGADSVRITVNGVAQPVSARPGSHVELNRVWRAGDVVELTMGMSLTLEPTPDDASVRAVRYGPVLLAGEYGGSNLTALPRLQPDSLTATGQPLVFRARANNASVTLSPFHALHHQRHSVYWRIG